MRRPSAITAGAALAVVAAFLAAGQVQVFAQGIEQGGAVVDLKGLGFTVDVERYFGHGGCSRLAA
jgi:hypothetical protein